MKRNKNPKEGEKKEKKGECKSGYEIWKMEEKSGIIKIMDERGEEKEAEKVMWMIKKENPTPNTQHPTPTLYSLI
jgi:hypothetical protein